MRDHRFRRRKVRSIIIEDEKIWAERYIGCSHTRPNWMHLWHGRWGKVQHEDEDVNALCSTYFAITLSDKVSELVRREEERTKRTFRLDVWQLRQDWVVRFLLLLRWSESRVNSRSITSPLSWRELGS